MTFGARWRLRRRASFRVSRRRSPRSPARAARRRSWPSCARSGPRSDMRRRRSAPSESSIRRGAHYGALTTPGPVELHQNAGRTCRTRRDASRDGGVVARDRSAPPRRHARRRRGLHQFFARPSRPSRRHGGVFRREDAALRYAAAPGPDGGDRRRQRRRVARHRHLPRERPHDFQRRFEGRDDEAPFGDAVRPRNVAAAQP